MSLSQYFNVLSILVLPVIALNTCHSNCGAISEFAQNLGCSCDIHCTTLSDCCHDFKTECPDVYNLSLLGLSSLSSVKARLHFPVAVATKCPEDANAHLKILCEDPFNTSFNLSREQESLLAASFYDMNTRVFFANIYCFLCLGYNNVAGIIFADRLSDYKDITKSSGAAYQYDSWDVDTYPRFSAGPNNTVQCSIGPFQVELINGFACDPASPYDISGLGILNLSGYVTIANFCVCIFRNSQCREEAMSDTNIAAVLSENIVTPIDENFGDYLKEFAILFEFVPAYSLDYKYFHRLEGLTVGPVDEFGIPTFNFTLCSRRVEIGAKVETLGLACSPDCATSVQMFNAVILSAIAHALVL